MITRLFIPDPFPGNHSNAPPSQRYQYYRTAVTPTKLPQAHNLSHPSLVRCKLHPTPRLITHVVLFALKLDHSSSVRNHCSQKVGSVIKTDTHTHRPSKNAPSENKQLQKKSSDPSQVIRAAGCQPRCETEKKVLLNRTESKTGSRR